MLCRIELGQGERQVIMMTDLAILGLFLNNEDPVLEGAEHVVAPVQAFPHQLELPEHRWVHDTKPLGLLDGDLIPQQHAAQPLQVVLCSGLVPPVAAPVHGEGYGSADEVTEDRRNEGLHCALCLQIITICMWRMQQ